MSHRVSVLFLVLALSTVFHPGVANAAVRAKEICPTIPFPRENACFSGAECRVGIRGDYIDNTDLVTVRSAPPDARTITVDSHGTEQHAFGCVDDGNSLREGYVILKLVGITGTGSINLRLFRNNGFGGRDHDDIFFDVKDGTHVRKLSYTATRGEAKTFALEGINLDTISVTAPDQILSASENTATVRLTFDRTGDVSLEEKITFAGGKPALNETNGWPTVRVSAPPPAPRPNLVPRNPSRLLQPQTVLTGGVRVDSSFCAGLQPDEVRDVAVPNFQFTVANTGNLAINQPFTVDVRNRATLAPLYSEVVQGLGIGASRVINVTWPGRQARVQVENRTNNTPCTGGPCIQIPSSDRFGCFLRQAINTVTADPDLILRVDSTFVIDNESSETDNELPVTQ